MTVSRRAEYPLAGTMAGCRAIVVPKPMRILRHLAMDACVEGGRLRPGLNSKSLAVQTKTCLREP